MHAASRLLSRDRAILKQCALFHGRYRSSTAVNERITRISVIFEADSNRIKKEKEKRTSILLHVESHFLRIF